MTECETHTMEQHIKDRLHDYEKAWSELQSENHLLREEVKELRREVERLEEELAEAARELGVKCEPDYD